MRTRQANSNADTFEERSQPSTANWDLPNPDDHAAKTITASNAEVQSETSNGFFIGIVIPFHRPPQQRLGYVDTSIAARLVPCAIAQRPI